MVYIHSFVRTLFVRTSFSFFFSFSFFLGEGDIRCTTIQDYHFICLCFLFHFFLSFFFLFLFFSLCIQEIKHITFTLPEFRLICEITEKERGRERKSESGREEEYI